MKMKGSYWKAGLALLLAFLLGLTPLCAAASGRVISLTAGVFFLLAQDMVELPVSEEETPMRTAELSADLLRLCSANSFGEKGEEEVRQLAQKALDNMTPVEREMFLNNFEGLIVPFCDGLFAGDKECLNLLEVAGVEEEISWADEAAGSSGDQDRWEILKEAVLSLD